MTGGLIDDEQGEGVWIKQVRKHDKKYSVCNFMELDKAYDRVIEKYYDRC